MKKVEWKVLSELMKNCRLSDRELADKIGSSQSTVISVRRKLEQKGIIKEYTLIPDFYKLGFGLMALTFSRFGELINEEVTENVKGTYRKKTKEDRKHGEEAKQQIIMQEVGRGLGFNGVTVSFHKDYKSFTEFIRLAERNAHVELKNNAKPFPILEIDKIESFLINLKDKPQYVPLTFKNLAKYLARMEEKDGKP